jgi:endonuclease YncB( thermonuclease family)
MRAIVLAMVLALMASPAAAISFSGAAEATDGDSLVMNGQRVRLFGVDAFEAEQTCRTARGRTALCGGAARQALAGLIRGRQVVCLQRDTDAYGRIVATCRTGETDLAAFLVRRGHAIAYTRYSAEYEMDEAEARLALRGAWAGAFEKPWEWRARRPQSAAIAARTGANAGACAIKGNIRRDGARLYHLPGTRAHARTVAEAMFCSEREAQKAGFRRANK